MIQNVVFLQYDPKHRKIVVFLPTQDSVDFHYDLFQHTICSAGDESEENMQLFKLHGNMLQKVEFLLCNYIKRKL